MKRIGISKKTRFEIFKRDDFTCQYCGKKIGQDVVLEIDHIIPVIEGGKNDLENLITSCYDCNRGKGKTLINNKIIKSDFAISLNSQKEQIEQIKFYKEYLLKKQEKLVELKSLIFEPVFEVLRLNKDTHFPVDINYLESIEKFISLLGLEEVLDAGKITASWLSNNYYKKNKVWRYFCGVCHQKKQ